MTARISDHLRELSDQAVVSRLHATPGAVGIPARGLTILAEIGVRRSFRRGETIVTEGKESTLLFIVLSGRVKMTRSLSTGRSAVLAILGEGELFGVASAFGGEPTAASVVAMQPTVCLEVEREDIYLRLEAQPRLIADVLPLLTRRLVECKSCLIELTGYRVEVRFALLLVKLAKSIGRSQAGGVFIPVALTRQELADMAGTTLETCIRVMSRWRKNGVVETVSDGFLIGDLEVLEQLSQPPA